ncbi:MAG: S8 family serine peptidase [Anaerolineae bacterium]|nr:S8 family serine peptidase [Anaerolineae bacterium]
MVRRDWPWLYLVTLVCLLCATVAAQPAASSSTPLLRLKTGVFDPRTKTGVDALAEAQALPPGPHLFIVQFDHPPTEADKDALRQAGVEVGDYLPDYAYLARGDRDALPRLASLKGVRWAGPYRPEYRLDPALARRAEPGDVIVETWPGRAGDVAKSLPALPAGSTTLRLHLDAPTLQQLAASPDVVWIGPASRLRLANDVARSDRIMRIESAWDRGLFGAGQIVGVADSGLDVGDLARLNPDFAGRIVATQVLTGTTWNDYIGHGTHVAGSIAGNGTQSGSDSAAHRYKGSFAGMAPEARLYVQAFQVNRANGEIAGLPTDLQELFGPAYAQGVRIHSDSWGGSMDDPANPWGGYSIESRTLDRFVWTHPDFLPVFAAGNVGTDGNMAKGDLGDGVIDMDSMSVPGTAKNSLTVGATEGLRSSGGLAGSPWLLLGLGSLLGGSGGIFFQPPIMMDDVSDNPEGMAAFSSRGPTDDGRIKPDIVAPGTNILSTRSADPGFDPTIYSWGVYDANPKYVFNGGTSMSTPLTAGAAALVREFLQKNGFAQPSAALVKGTLIHHARELTPGQYGTGPQQEIPPRPNWVEGWGRVDLGPLFPTAPTQQWFDDHTVGLWTGQTADYSPATQRLTVVNASVPLRVTLVWSDYPAALAAQAQLVNDLDLEVTSPSGVVYPLSIDRLNNVEMAEIRAPELGAWRVTVRAVNVPQGPQPFALVVTGGLGESTPPTPSPTPYTGPRPYSVYLPLVSKGGLPKQ